MDRPELQQVNVVVSDMDTSVVFYRLLGFEFLPTAPEWESHHRSARDAGTDLELDSSEFASRWDVGWRTGHTGVVVGLRYPTRQAVDEAYAKAVEAGYRSQQEPYDAGWGARYAVLEDPDGNAVGLSSPVDDDYRSAIEAPSPA